MEHKKPLLSFSDLIRILKKNVKAILIVKAIFFVLTLLFVFTRPLTYKATALFRDRKKAESSVSEGAKLLLYKDNDSHAEAMVIFQSRRLLEKVIRQMGLQASVKRTDSPEYGYLNRIKNNLISEVSYWTAPSTAVDLKQKSPLECRQVLYNGDQPLTLDIHFLTPQHFTVTNHQNEQLLGQGTIGQPYRYENWKFTLAYDNPISLEGREYRIKILPMPVIVQKVRKKLNITVAAKDSGLLNLTYIATDRYEAAHFLNALMTEYKQRLIDDRNHWAKAQVEYLEKRQNIVSEQLQTLMEQHASSVTQDLSLAGLFDIKHETDSLQKQQLACKQKLSDINLQLQRLSHIQEDGVLGFCNIPHGLLGDQVADTALKRLRDLKQNRDMLELAMQQSHPTTKAASSSPQQAIPEEFHGINLDTAHQLYLEYSKNLDRIQRDMREHLFITDQLLDPQFEVNSLSVLPTDAVTQNIIAKSMELALSLRDENNRSQREQERIKEALVHQKNFLKAHLERSTDLLQLNERFIKEKILSLQQMMIHLINQELLVLETHLKDHFHTQTTNLRQEQALIENQLQGVQGMMLGLPHKWVAEQALQLRVDANKELVREVTKLAENKNITKNLEVVQSSLVDHAIPPFTPQGPYLLLLSILGGTVGLFCASAFVLTRGMICGFPLWPENLKEMGQEVAGTLHLSSFQQPPHKALQIAGSDLDTLRRIASFLMPTPHKQLTLAILGHGPDYTAALADLLHNKGKRVLVMPIDFTDTCKPDSSPGLLQVLEGTADYPTITSHGHFDTIAAGGTSQYSTELLTSTRFHALLNRLYTNYDLILATTHARPDSPNVHMLLSEFDSLLISVHEETYSQLQPYTALRTRNDKPQRTCFIFYSGAFCKTRFQEQI